MNSQLCIECGKDFKSSKALHGHLRWHPERNYRGTNPKSQRNIIRKRRKDISSAGGTSGTNSSSRAVQQPIYVQPLSWCPPNQSPPPLKKMRSNIHNLSIKPTGHSSSLSTFNSTLQLNPPPQPYTSHHMPSLPTAVAEPNFLGRHPAKLDPIASSHGGEGTYSSPATAMQQPFLQINNQPAEQTVVRVASILSSEANCNEGADSQSDRLGTSSSFTTKEPLPEGPEKKRSMKDGYIHGGQYLHHNQRAFSCIKCSKTFDSEEALGGHITSHHVKSKTIERKSGKPVRHPCNICGEIYPTGRALGGHKRKHRETSRSESQLQPQHKPEYKLVGFRLFGTWISVE